MAIEETQTIIDTVATCDLCGAVKKMEQEETQEALGNLRREGWASIDRSAYAEASTHFQTPCCSARLAMPSSRNGRRRRREKRDGNQERSW